jgi:predicted kinase
MKPILVVVRGLPGSNRADFATTTKGNFLHFGADSILVENGKYDASKAEAASKWCYQQARAALAAGNNVIVSDTLARLSELEPYFDLAEELNTSISVIRALKKSDKYEVPDEILEEALIQWEQMGTTE